MKELLQDYLNQNNKQKIVVSYNYYPNCGQILVMYKYYGEDDYTTETIDFIDVLVFIYKAKSETIVFDPTKTP